MVAVMKSKTAARRPLSSLLPLLAAAGAALITPASAHAQQSGAPSASVTPANPGLALDGNRLPDPLTPAMQIKQTSAQDLAARLSRTTGALVVADRTVSTLPVTLDLAPASLSATLARIAAALPAGTQVKTVLIPAPPAGASIGGSVATRPTGDQIAAFLEAQTALYRPAPAVPSPMTAGASGAPAATTAGVVPETPLPPGQVEILGKRLSMAEAAPIIRTLGLRPVYLLTNPTRTTDAAVQQLAALQADALRLMLNMTPEQQKAASDQQFDQMMNMDPGLRRQMFQQQMQMGGQFFQRIQNLPTDQRRQFWLDLTGGRFDGSAIPQGFNPFGALGSSGGGRNAPQ
jgi:hypothetical protein